VTGPVEAVRTLTIDVVEELIRTEQWRGVTLL
jgi:hypothetical protein